MMKKILLFVLAAMFVAMPTMAQKKSKKKVQTTQQTAAPTFVHPWFGKRVAYFGDSIIDPNTLKGGEFYRYLEEWLGLTSYVYGISGRQWDDIPNQAERLKAEHGDDVDAIIVYIGTNDFNAGIPLGQWFTERSEKVLAANGELQSMQLRLRRDPVMDKTTYRGRINIALDCLKRMYPAKQIVLLTPHHRGIADFGDHNQQPDEHYQNKCGEYVDAYINDVIEAGKLWAVPVIDWSNLSGLFPLIEEHNRYFRDAGWDLLHPNAEGHKRMARTLYYQLLTLPCCF